MDCRFNEEKILDRDDLDLLILYDAKAVKNLFKHRYLFQAKRQGNTKRVKELFESMGKASSGFIYAKGGFPN